MHRLKIYRLRAEEAEALAARAIGRMERRAFEVIATTWRQLIAGRAAGPPPEDSVGTDTRG